jgi:hypothetical protein
MFLTTYSCRVLWVKFCQLVTKEIGKNGDFCFFNVNLNKISHKLGNFTRVLKPQNWKQKRWTWFWSFMAHPWQKIIQMVFQNKIGISHLNSMWCFLPIFNENYSNGFSKIIPKSPTLQPKKHTHPLMPIFYAPSFVKVILLSLPIPMCFSQIFWLGCAFSVMKQFEIHVVLRQEHTNDEWYVP